ncbi:ABC transporter permease [Flavisolibacter tropicus]|uniref:ABC transporter permease n=1 Tax=Flavisolibacter tropicus TaxID=1492898 RepID=A0A172TTR8_9BACT|nr:ABC transporter permease [Flavisolibacter tropicus]ANE50358.1 hypothetical protein SY85_07470 [Flavisolibacter tropicus]
MNILISTQTEILKTKRSASFWLSIIAALFLPTLFSIGYSVEPESLIRQMKLSGNAWSFHFGNAWQVANAFLFPMFIILICSLIPQIEYKNNTWKQVYASPQPLANVYFSKFISIHMMIFFFFMLFNVFLISFAIIVNLINSKFQFLDQSIDWAMLGRLCLKTYISILGITAIQYWLSFRIKNFIAPVGIGLAMIIASIILAQIGWKHIYKFPFAHPFLTLQSIGKNNSLVIENHELNSIGYCAFFLILGYLDLKFRKERG